MGKIKFYQIIMLICITSGLFTSCKKTSITETPTPTPTTTTTTTASRTELTRDSMFLYAKELYYWNTSLPTYEVFNPRSYSSNETELYALSQIAINATTGRPYEYLAGSSEPKYSYLDYVTTSTGATGALKADLDGTALDFGFSAAFRSNTTLYVSYVYPTSPAGQAGLTRGCLITSVNGSTNINSTSNSSIDMLNAAIFGTSNSLTLTFTDLSGTSKTATLVKANYTFSPILYTNIYTVGTKKVGYMVFNSFTDNVSAELGTLFSRFASEGITELIVDLRSNGGGYVSTATELSNYIVPASQTGNTMFTYFYNSYLQNLTTTQRQTSVLSHQPLLSSSGGLQTYTSGVNGRYATYADLNYSTTSADNIEKFAKVGTLNLSRVYFLVTGSTASASELTINNLKPVMDVKVIGQTTYGKPVGFFPIRINDFDMYIPEFETKNQLNAGGYYAGMSPDQSAVQDLSKDFGNTQETLLKYALNYAERGTFVLPTSTTSSTASKSTTAAKQFSSVTEDRDANLKLNLGTFNGMVGTPKRTF